MDALSTMTKRVSIEDFEQEVIRAYNMLRAAIQTHISAEYENIERRVAIATALRAFAEITRSCYGIHNEQIIDNSAKAIVETVLNELELSKPPKATA